MSIRKIAFEEGWQCLEEGIAKLTKILEGYDSRSILTPSELIHFYECVYTMCLQRPDCRQEVYCGFKMSLGRPVSSLVWPSLMDKDNEALLQELVRMWSNYQVMVRLLSFIFSYLERCYTIWVAVPPLKDVAASCFFNLVCPALSGKIRNVVISMIHQEREGQKIDVDLLQNFMGFILDAGAAVQVFYEEFEKAIFECTLTYHAQKTSEWIMECTLEDYLLKVGECLKRESERLSRYLIFSSSFTTQTSLKIVQKELLLSQKNELFEKEHSVLHVLLRDGKVEDLKRMYDLFHCVDGGLDPIILKFKQHILSDGESLVDQSEDAASNKKADNQNSAGEMVFIKRVIELHDERIGYITKGFNGDNQFYKALGEAFGVFCNKMIASTSVAELLAIHADNILKKGGGSETNEEAVEEALVKIVQLLVHIHDKDLFAKFYRKKLSRRLLFDRSANDGHEKFILSKLKQQNGIHFTSKMEGMVTDMTLAKEKQVEFAKYLQSHPQENLCIDLSVNVLTATFWQNHKLTDLHLPAEMANGIEVFNKYYSLKNHNRKLIWMFSLGTCTMVGRFDAKSIELIVTTHQAVLLMLFNTSERLSYKEITEQLNLPNKDVIRLLHSLSCAKYKILLKEPNNRSISKDDIFEFNSKFTERMRRIKIPLPPSDKKKRIHEDVDKDRRFVIDASLVRIMKRRKVMGYQQLLGECIQQLSHSFKPDVKVINRRIEDLIEQDYMERDKDDANVFHYVA